MSLSRASAPRGGAAGLRAPPAGHPEPAKAPTRGYPGGGRSCQYLDGNTCPSQRGTIAGQGSTEAFSTAGGQRATGDPTRQCPRRRGTGRLTPEQSERLGFGDEHQGVHGPQVEQAHQDDVPPDDVLPLAARSRPLLGAAALRAFDPRTDFLLGVAEGDLSPAGGRARHGWGERPAGGGGNGSGKALGRLGALRWGRELLPFRRDGRTFCPLLPSPSRGPALVFRCSAWPKDANLGARHLLLA